MFSLLAFERLGVRATIPLTPADLPGSAWFAGDEENRSPMQVICVSFRSTGLRLTQRRLECKKKIKSFNHGYRLRSSAAGSYVLKGYTPSFGQLSIGPREWALPAAPAGPRDLITFSTRASQTSSTGVIAMGATQNVLADPVPDLAPPPLVPSGAIQIPLPFRTASRPEPEKVGVALPPKAAPRTALVAAAGRCLEKGCVFPALPGADGRCLHHQRQQREPSLYCSHQPSSALVQRSKFGPARVEDVEPNASARGFDRRRLVAERERFLGEQQ